MAMRSTRRALLRSGAGALIAAGIWPGTLHADDAAGGAEFYFAQINDLHLIDQQCGDWLQKVFRSMKERKEKIQFCLVCGDLVENGTAEQLSSVKEILGATGMPMYTVIGNHDYTAQTDRKAYEENFPGRLNYKFDCNGMQFIGLDTSEGLRYEKTNVQAGTLTWLDTELGKLDKKRPTVVFTHFPMGPGVRYRPGNADDLLNRFKEFNLQAVFCGHYHAFTEKSAFNTIITTDKCCALKRGNHDGSKEKGFFLCRVKDGRVSREFIEMRP